MEELEQQSSHISKMTNFPGGRPLPTKLSPFADDNPSQPLAGNRASRSIVSLFSDPPDEAECLRKSEYTLPHCYFRSYIQGESEFKLKPQHMKQLSTPALFSSFYLTPGDILQAVAAQELSSRGWKYHSEQKKWFRQATGNDAPSSSGLVVFDPVRWEEVSQSGSVDASKFMPASAHAIPGGVNVGNLRTGPPGRLPPASPPSMVPQQPPITPSNVIR
jgi:hypothetical protein